jgi:hypothetical protein
MHQILRHLLHRLSQEPHRIRSPRARKDPIRLGIDRIKALPFAFSLLCACLLVRPGRLDEVVYPCGEEILHYGMEGSVSAGFPALEEGVEVL